MYYVYKKLMAKTIKFQTDWIQMRSYKDRMMSTMSTRCGVAIFTKGELATTELEVQLEIEAWQSMFI